MISNQDDPNKPIEPYPIGTQFQVLPDKLEKIIYTIIDIHTTYNHNGHYVKTLYIATRPYIGASIEGSFNGTEVARGVARLAGREC